MKATGNHKPRVLLFDLGGVLVHWEGNEPLIRLSSRDLTEEEARRFWIASPWVRRFEHGLCAPLEFAVGALEELSIQMSPEDFLEEFLQWDRGPFPEALALLDSLSTQYRLACLSNNKELHWGKIRDSYGFGARFHHCYLSHEIGKMKPDREAYEHVITDLGCPGEEILFFDDTPECVEGARKSGMRAYRVQGVEEVRDVLRDLGLEL
jgi:putative hydrolase of the HAD superfamily